MSESNKYVRITLRAFLAVAAVLAPVTITPYQANGQASGHVARGLALASDRGRVARLAAHADRSGRRRVAGQQQGRCDRVRVAREQRGEGDLEALLHAGDTWQID